MSKSEDNNTHDYQGPDLDDIGPEQVPPTDPDEQTRQAIADYGREKDYYRELRRQQLAILKNEAKQRDSFARKIFRIMTVWLSVVIAVVVFNKNGIAIEPFRFILNVSENVLITLVGSTTINVIGLVLVVMKYVFREKAADIKPIHREGTDNRF